jgi:hypothetical protein
MANYVIHFLCNKNFNRGPFNATFQPTNFSVS